MASAQLQEALASYSRAVELDPEHADANFNAALARLCLGDFRDGWRQYEYRLKKKEFATLVRAVPQPLWRGEKDLHGKTILLMAEQGFGDAIQFVRYAPLVAALGAKVLLGVRRPLADLLATVPGVAAVFGENEPLPEFDLYCPLLSLPLAFETELATIPANVPYIRAHEERIAKWHGRLPDGRRLRVGICWAGTSAHSNNRRRSMPLESFAAVLSAADVDFVSLQTDVDETDAAMLRAAGVLQLGSEFVDFADTAAVISHARSGDLRRHVGCASCGRHGQGRRRPDTVFAGFQMAARSHGYAVVSDHAAVSPTGAGRLGRAAWAAAG